MRRRHRIGNPPAVGCTALLALVSGCATTGTGAYPKPGAGARDPARAQALTLQAVPLMDSDPAKAERLLADALAADLWHGPAHNNLGTLYLAQGRLYDAAEEFEWARKLMPGHPDPRMNLALVLETAGRTDEALATYATAIEVFPGHMPSVEAMARLQVREGRTDDRTEGWLREIALRGETGEWREWAMGQLAKGGD